MPDQYQYRLATWKPPPWIDQSLKWCGRCVSYTTHFTEDHHPLGKKRKKK